jgi:dTDP-4-dehydrorhamnose 3,5-epimerase-like enzyme
VSIALEEADHMIVDSKYCEPGAFMKNRNFVLMSIPCADVNEVQGAYIFTPTKYTDQRGFFQEHYNSEKYAGQVSEIKQISVCECSFG